MAEKLVIEVVLTKLSEAESRKAFDNVEKAAGKAGSKAGKTFSDKFTNSFKDIGKRLVGITAAFTAFRTLKNNVTAGIQSLRNFERSIAEVNSILPKNEKLTKSSADAFKNFANTFGTSTAKQAQAFYSIVSAGVKGTTTQLRTLEIANKAAVAGLVDIDIAAKALVSSVNAYARTGLTATQASDALFVAVREGQTTFGELSANIGTVAPVAASAGLKFEELAGAISGVTKAGIRTDIAITGIRSLLSSLIKVTPQSADEAKRLGLEFTTAALRTKGFVKFLEDLREKTGGNEVALGKLFPNVRALGPVLQVVNGDFEDFARIQGEVERAVGATGEAANILKGNLDFKLNQVTSSFASLREEVAKLFTPNLIRFASSLNSTLVQLNPASTDINKATVRIEALKVQLNDLEKVDPAKPFFQSKGLLITYGQQAASVQSQIDKLTESLNGLNEAVRIKESPVEQLLQAQRELNDLNDALSDVKNNLGDIQGRSDVVLISEIAEKTREIEMLEAALRKLNISPPAPDLSATSSAAQDFFEKNKALVQNTGEYIVFEEAKKLQRLQELRDADLISDRMLQEARFTVRQEAIQKLNDAEENSRENSKFTLDSFLNGFAITSKKLQFKASEVSKIMQDNIGQGFGNAFEAAGMAMREGASELDAFGEALQKMLAQMASQLGDYFIAQGIAHSANPMMPGSGAGMIAAGFGLKLLAGLLGGSGGSSSSDSGGRGSSGGRPEQPDTTIEIFDEDIERQTSNQINITVEGSLVQQEELGQFIAEVQSEINQKNGAVIVNPRFA